MAGVISTVRKKLSDIQTTYFDVHFSGVQLNDKLKACYEGAKKKKKTKNF